MWQIPGLWLIPRLVEMEVVDGAPESVMGHYMQQGQQLLPLLGVSGALFNAVVSDVDSIVEQELEANPQKLNQEFLILCWNQDIANSPEGDAAESLPSKPNASVIHRTLLMLACYHGSLRVVSLLLSKGTDPLAKAQDGVTARE